MVKIFMGGIRPLPPENRPTGIFKTEVMMPVWLGPEGLAGDAQADRRVHGGPEKALHQYPATHYARLATAFPELRPQLLPGALGENLSVPGWDETKVCIGDIFRLGDALIQVSQPRSPCWKIDSRFGCEGMTRLIDAEGITGWYFRVIEAGTVEPGCVFERVEQPTPEATLALFLDVWRSHRPTPARLRQLAATLGLSTRWHAKFLERAARLENL